MAVFDFLNPLANITPKFTEEQLESIVQWFDENAKPQLTINDGPPINVVTVTKVIEFLELKKFHRRCFHYPSYHEIMLIVEKCKAGVTKMITKEQFIYMLNTWVSEPEIRHELSLAFKVFDTEKRDFLEINEIASIVTSYGDFFSSAETKELLRDANVRGDGNVFYEDFIESIFNQAPELYKLKVDYLYDNADEDPSVPPLPIIEPEEPLPPPPPPPLPPLPAKGKGAAKKKK